MEPMPPGVGRWRFQIERNTASAGTMLRAEEELLDRVRDGEPPACRIWQAARGIVVPRSLTDLPAFAEAAAGMEAGGWPSFLGFQAARRSRRCPAFSICRSLSRRVERLVVGGGYRHLLAPLSLATRGFGLETESARWPAAFAPVASISPWRTKISSARAQRRRSGGRPGWTVILAHATVWIARTSTSLVPPSAIS